MGSKQNVQATLSRKKSICLRPLIQDDSSNDGFFLKILLKNETILTLSRLDRFASF